MGWSFRKSIKVAPGIRINLSKSGVSTSIGGRGLTYNTRGRVTASIPGTGIRFTHNLRGARTSRPVSSVVSGSSSLDADVTERLSKRERATQDFVQKVRSRTSTALVDYFFSHGVYVHGDDLSEAVTLEEHQGFLESLAPEFDATTNAVRLAADIGSISLAEKEKAMRAVYEIEKQCADHHGERAELNEAASALLSAVRSWPSTPGLASPFVVALLGSFIAYAANLWAGLGLTAFALLYGASNVSRYKRKRTAALAVIDATTQRFNSLLTAEITPRPTLLTGKDSLIPKAVGVGGVVLVATLFAVVMHFTHPTGLGANTTDGDAPETSVSASPSTEMQGSQPRQAESEFSWLAGKSPSDVVNDSRFKAAFRNVSRVEWKKISERLAVSHVVIVQSKDGFLVGEGCMAQGCDSDKAAFAINESTGKGDLIVMETPSSSNSPTFRTYQWRNMPVAQTPLADWKQQHQAASEAAAQPSQANVPSLATSFDCSKAHSDAEHLICGDAELAADDVELAALYAKAKAAATDEAAFRERTRAQWNYREQTCHERECLVRWYADQKVALSEIANTGSSGQ
ncbi:DUF4236 domain-containing protein [Paraburkholderia sp. BR13444]|uniref:DUF4236 domain-containing protein n=1 Tax=Paraburkholderia sp. BR13444 TaxID=3236997 RepID=UPI0034CDE04F